MPRAAERQGEQPAAADAPAPGLGPRERHGRPWTLPERTGLEAEVERVRDFLGEWVETCDPEMREMVRYQLSSGSKYFRPVTTFACHRAATGGAANDHLVPICAAVELFHNYATILDDINDRDRYRRGKLALHCRYGRLHALMTSAYLVFAAHDFLAGDAYVTRVFTDLGKRVAAVEVRQWRLRRQPFGIDIWREIAGEDTGGMFAACARVATRDDRLARFGYLLGTLYHGCDDVADLRGTEGLGAHSERDVTDRILTLPAAIATEDPTTAELFAEAEGNGDEELARRLVRVLPEAESALDELAREAEQEARSNTSSPEGLIELVRATRELSRT
jgi:geranylgeranyl pyrophosphate synthase